MAQIVVTNISGSPVRIEDFYVEIPAGGSVTTTRAATELSGMASLQAALAAGEVTLAVTYSADEIASGLMSPPASITGDDMAPVDAADAASGLVVIRSNFAAGVAGTADDVTIYAAGALPFKMRLLDGTAWVSTAIGLSTLTVRDEAAGAGTAALAFDSATTGRKSPTAASNATSVLTPGAAKGLFVRRSDRGVAGEVVIYARREN